MHNVYNFTHTSNQVMAYFVRNITSDVHVTDQIQINELLL